MLMIQAIRFQYKLELTNIPGSVSADAKNIQMTEIYGILFLTLKHDIMESF